MLTDKIIKLANNTKNYGLENNFTHKECGDKIIVELVLKKGKINSMRYITESCIYCQASASLFSNKIENLDRNNLLKLDTLLKKSFKEKVSFAKKYSFLKQLFNKENYKRSDCILLPLNAILKAINK